MIFNARAHDDLYRLIRHVENQLDAGFTLDDSLKRLKLIETIDHKKVELLEALLKGSASDPAQFSPYKTASYDSLAKLSGLLSLSGASIKDSLKAMIECLRVNQNNAYQVWKGLKTLATYLVVVLALVVICTSIYTLKVLPQFKEMFDSLGGELPAFTASVLGASELLMQWWFAIIPVILLLVYLLFNIAKKVTALEPISPSMMLIPGFNPLFKLHFKYLLISYTHILMSGGMQGKIALSKSLEVLAKSIDFLKKDEAFEDLMVAYELDTLAGEIQFELGDIEHQYLAELAQLREKIMLFSQTFLALIVGTIVIAMYLPIFQMGQIV